jgi:hypothetical protein
MIGLTGCVLATTMMTCSKQTVRGISRETPDSPVGRRIGCGLGTGRQRMIINFQTIEIGQSLLRLSGGPRVKGRLETPNAHFPPVGRLGIGASLLEMRADRRPALVVNRRGGRDRLPEAGQLL